MSLCGGCGNAANIYTYATRGLLQCQPRSGTTTYWPGWDAMSFSLFYVNPSSVYAGGTFRKRLRTQTCPSADLVMVESTPCKYGTGTVLGH